MMKLSLYLFIFFLIIASSNCQNKKDKNNGVSINETNKKAELEVLIDADNTIKLPKLEGIEIFLKNNSDKDIKIWQDMNPSGLLELYFIFETKNKEKIIIEPIVLNWRSDFSKIREIKPGEKFKLDTRKTNWNCKDSNPEEKGFVIAGKLKAYYSVKQSFKGGEDLWKGEISSNEVQVTLEHTKFLN